MLSSVGDATCYVCGLGGGGGVRKGMEGVGRGRTMNNNGKGKGKVNGGVLEGQLCACRNPVTFIHRQCLHESLSENGGKLKCHNCETFFNVTVQRAIKPKHEWVTPGWKNVSILYLLASLIATTGVVGFACVISYFLFSTRHFQHSIDQTESIPIPINNNDNNDNNGIENGTTLVFYYRQVEQDEKVAIFFTDGYFFNGVLLLFIILGALLAMIVVLAAASRKYWQLFQRGTATFKIIIIK